MLIIKGYKTELDPNNIQRTSLLRHAGIARFAYNWGLQCKIEAFKSKAKIPNAIQLHREWNQWKLTNAPWWEATSKCSPQEALRNLDKAFDNFFRKCKQRKIGKYKGKLGFPRFKSKHRGVGSFRLTGTIKVNPKSVQLPRLGELRLKESNYIPTEGVKILSATVSEHAGRWLVSIQVEQNISDDKPVKDSHDVVGVDLGIKSLAVCSDGQVFENPRALKKRLRKLRRLQRSVARKVKGSKNRMKATAKVAELHYRIACVRKDAIHKITSTLTRTKSVVVIEDLNVAGMLKNRCLSRAIADVGLGEFRRQMEYKGGLHGCRIVLADRFFPSSKTCNTCGYVNQELTLSDREWDCPSCGKHLDRDANASYNLESLVKKVAVSSTETVNACEGRGPLVQELLA